LEGTEHFSRAKEEAETKISKTGGEKERAQKKQI
jgi:hypothetical protein